MEPPFDLGQRRPLSGTSDRSLCGGMKNFAYGSNMCQWWLQRRVAAARYEFVARLPEHALRFHKVSKLDGSGKGDVVHTGDPTDGVWGVVVHVPDDERRLLDTAEGPGYEVRELTVYDRQGRSHQVEAYVAKVSAIDPAVKPTDSYLGLIVEGAKARGLPADYIEKLEQVETQPGSDPEIVAGSC